MKDQTPITLQQAAHYEVYSNNFGIGNWVMPVFLCRLGARYFKFKALRKYRRYIAMFKRIHGETKP